MRYRAICNNREFSRMYAKGKSYVHPQVVLYVLKNKNKPTRVGFTATKKVGNAVKRNRARRVMKEALSQHLPKDTKGFDLVLVARGQTPFIKSTQLSKTIGKLFAKAGLEDRAMQMQKEVQASQQPAVLDAAEPLAQPENTVQ
ncbi:MAG: ribonuclease P protein component [Faecalibacterium sp.]